MPRVIAGHGSMTRRASPQIVGHVVALWSASGCVAAFMRATNSIYEVYRVAILKTIAAPRDENWRVVRRRRNTLVRVVEPGEVYGAGSSGAV